MDLSAEYYLQTVDTVFVRHALPKGTMTHRGAQVDPACIRRVALLTIEGENDDISGLGQTEAAHRLCVNIPPERRSHWMQPGVGHYGVFNGSRFRAEIAPRITDFVVSNDGEDGHGGKRAAQNAPRAVAKPNGSGASTTVASAVADPAKASAANE
jgi:poly(3-hydroxybutyrate) depolymerase